MNAPPNINIFAGLFQIADLEIPQNSFVFAPTNDFFDFLFDNIITQHELEEHDELRTILKTSITMKLEDIVTTLSQTKFPFEWYDRVIDLIPIVGRPLHRGSITYIPIDGFLLPLNIQLKSTLY